MVSSSIFKVFGMTRPGIEPRSPGPLANTLTAGPMSRYFSKDFFARPLSLCRCDSFSIYMYSVYKHIYYVSIQHNQLEIRCGRENSTQRDWAPSPPVVQPGERKETLLSAIRVGVNMLHFSSVSNSLSQ